MSPLPASIVFCCFLGIIFGISKIVSITRGQ